MTDREPTAEAVHIASYELRFATSSLQAGKKTNHVYPGKFSIYYPVDRPLVHARVGLQWDAQISFPSSDKNQMLMLTSLGYQEVLWSLEQASFSETA